ncbi:C-type lectin domain family 2 member D-like [Hemicordylus capensis]|uniref:C-type lectin domain family 2 member D-like n=1 Tax=Hemicordylus capensis TaxID=884348 RepID=UPI0023037171|nr:C-type lectin domain family 2 member D-like [Hemicordylus capensis]XP_053156802.1 C-type lectin domain family 2 member D-like [Hemicordylus capensis]XP_053156803.1 C-type lectin domain family 2 member D-like [Hemicordylus capensis]XP_053156804.1 C-type lectin domain family 2 member D-like [Hemicordylus capensis]XP_053156805.1 C-type lectin domain family 2 member D-like [Hemicordylus capensis]XP_053156806.1 C-type lectin domain family 2 member D-like [Hemicordylus capensis]
MKMMGGNNPAENEVQVPLNKNGNPQNGSGNHSLEQKSQLCDSTSITADNQNLKNQNLKNKQSHQRGFNCSKRFRQCCVDGNIAKPVFIVTAIFALCSVCFNIILICENAKLKQLQGCTQPPVDTSCLQGWVRNEGMCFFFSQTEGTWNSSQSNCSSSGGSLVALDTQQEKEFVEHKRDLAEYWINLRRENVEQSWKWPNGSFIHNWFTIKGEGFCAYLNDDVISSTYCDQKRYWICKKPALPT